MIQCTFQHVPDILEKGETRLWHSGIKTWRDLIQHPEKHPHFTRRMWKSLQNEARNCQNALEKKDYFYFLNHIPERLHWRLYPNLKGKILYFDTEMTGLEIETDQITTIATYDGQEIKWFVRGQNLQEFPSYLANFPAVCSFDGKKMDVNFIEKEFGINFCHIHFDLFELSRWLHISGGLKQIEKRLDINRNELEGIDGRSAIYLWHQFQATNDKDYLHTLLAYNIEDIIHLPLMLSIFYDQLRQQFQLPIKGLPTQNLEIVRPFSPKEQIVQEVQTFFESDPEIIEG